MEVKEKCASFQIFDFIHSTHRKPGKSIISRYLPPLNLYIFLAAGEAIVTYSLCDQNTPFRVEYNHGRD